MLSKQGSANMIIMNNENQLSTTESAKKLERIISLQSFVSKRLDE